MQRPTLDDFREVRRGLPVVAAVLFVAALAFPMWRISVQAVQYPNTVLHVQLYAYPHLTGDFTEMARLNHYIGFYYPDPVFVEPNFPVQERAIDVPEWSLGPVAFVAVSLLSVFVAVAPTTEKLKRGLTYQFVGTVAVFGVLVADIQYRLWQAGHTLDPDAPVMGVSGFTPPLWGRYSVANITSVSRFGPGAYMAMVAVFLLAVALFYRDEPVTVRELPGRIRRRVERLLDRGTGAEEPTGPTTDADTGDR
ncbi:hypothetical protein [Haloarcula pellucida]|uniref:Uncharacterized protein n=1 Tax=Haloarcula pellucida TaxID=1427151 RepID=A0A830GFL8_9EURY|nr:hypothetical protein [Halomicroarcula pellucida]GGN84963.1 hypothetical protein GCM10009030_00960 [Halomicroarcula pellucida]